MSAETDLLLLSAQALLELALLTVGTMLLLKWLLFRRMTTLGHTIARNNLFMAIAYFAASASLRVEFFRGVPWRLTITTLVIVTAGHVIWEVVQFYGGWRATGRELLLSLLEVGWWWIERPGWLWGRVTAGGRRL